MTQTRKEALIELRDGVKAGRELNALTASYAFPDWKPLQKWSLMDLLEWACDPSDIRAMGAAKALHEAVLPGWFWSIKPRACDFVATVCRSEILGASETEDNPARAWLLAILEALIAQEPNT